MMRLTILASCVALSGCAGLQSLTSNPSSDAVDTLKALGDHIDGCDRHYQGGIGLGASFTFNIDCKAKAVPLSEFRGDPPV